MRHSKKHLYESLKKSLVFIFVIGLLIACNPSTGPEKLDPKPTSSEPKSIKTYDSLIYKSFILDRATIIGDPRLAKNPTPRYKRLILKFQFNHQHDDTLNLGLFIYPAKRTGSTTHGEGEPPIELTVVDTLRKLPRKLFLGNNYLNWYDIKSIIYEPSSDNLIANFSHIILIPRDKTPLQAGWNYHLHYGFRIVANDGSIIFPIGGAAGGSSHPSPPAPPQ